MDAYLIPLLISLAMIVIVILTQKDNSGVVAGLYFTLVFVILPPVVATMASGNEKAFSYWDLLWSAPLLSVVFGIEHLYKRGELRKEKELEKIKTMSSEEAKKYKAGQRDSHITNRKSKTITEAQRYLIYDHPPWSNTWNSWRLQFLLWKSMRASHVVIGIMLLFLSPLLTWLLALEISFFTFYSYLVVVTYVQIFVHRRVRREYNDVTVVGTIAESNENLAEEVLDVPEFPPNETIDTE